MKTKKGFLTLLASFLLLVSTFTVVYRPFAGAQISAGNLTGRILDHGVDTNANGLYDYLEIDFEISVSIAGQYYLSAYALQNAQGRNIYTYGSNWLQENLTVGIQYINITMSGPEIFNSHLNPQNVSSVQLYYSSSTTTSEYMGGFDSIALSRIYNYTEFDPPSAYLTGNILDHGVDTNGNGLYDYLEIGIGIEVTTAGEFQAQIGAPKDKNGGYINVYNSSQTSLSVGLQYMNLSLSGPQIFSSRLDPQNISSIQLIILNPTNYIGYYADEILNVPLSRIYNYTEFDPPSAYLTGNVTDRGVDTDGNGLFDYLQVGVELNITQAGDYSITADGLSTNGGGFYQSNFFDYQVELEIFQPGIHTVNMNFSGPGIRQSQINPTYIMGLSVRDNANYMTLDYLNNIPLSKIYDNTLFDAPSKITQVNIKVYPDGAVAVDGALNYTRMYPENTYYPRFNATMGISTTGNTTVGTSEGTITFPENPYIIDNSLEEHSRQTYENGLLNETSSTSMILTPEMRALYPFNTTDLSLDAAYSEGFFNVNLEGSTVLPTVYSAISPFNMTDTTVQADFDGNLVTGNITFHTIPGLEFADVTLDFSGNRTSLQFAGNLNVTFANYGYLQVNKTDLDQEIADLKANFTDTGPRSLFNETDGNLNCSNLVLNEIPWADPTQGANVEYNITIVGNFTAALASLMYPESGYYYNEGYRGYEYALLESAASSVSNGSVVINYYHNSQTAQISMHLTLNAQELANELIQLVPPTISQLPPMGLNETQIDAILKIANATTFALTDASVSESYSSTDGRFSANFSLAANGAQLKQDILPVLPDTSPSNLHGIFESFFNTTFGNTTSLDSTLDMTNGTGTFNATVTYQGNLEAEVNNIKDFYVALWFNAMQYPSYALPLNGTELNINNLQVQADLGQNWMYLNFSGLSFKPPSDKVDELTFKLKNWLEALSYLQPPQQFEQFAVTVTGESSANQTVILSRPYNVPPPESFSSDYRSIAWNNTSFSNLQDLTFLIASREQVNFDDQNYDIPILTNSTIKDFVFDASAKRISFNVTGEPGAGFCNVTIPRNLLNATVLSDWTVTFDGNVLTQNEFNITQNNDYVFVYLNYTHSEHVIAIRGTQLLPEFQPDILPLALAIALVIIAIATIKRRKPEPLKTTISKL